jgi:hypothetical protein
VEKWPVERWITYIGVLSGLTWDTRDP